jgi:hypothetical protein
MTNEEKAKTLVDGLGIIYTDCNRVTIKKLLIKMAEWKDEQIDTIMLTIEGCLRSFFESQGNTQESIDNFIDALKTQINENLNKL